MPYFILYELEKHQLRCQFTKVLCGSIQTQLHLKKHKKTNNYSGIKKRLATVT